MRPKLANSGQSDITEAFQCHDEPGTRTNILITISRARVTGYHMVIMIEATVIAGASALASMTLCVLYATTVSVIKHLRRPTDQTIDCRSGEDCK